jgi:hypothetical protein
MNEWQGIRAVWIGLVAWVGWTFCGSAALFAAGKPVVKKLIEMGWDEPDTAFMRQHVEEMERTPFDGCVFHFFYTEPNGSQGNFMWEGWGKRAFSEAELQPALDDLQAVSWHRFSHNFLRFNVTPGDVDWFDDFSPILNNACLAAGLARAGQCAGIMLDTEQYQAPLFEYRRQRDAQQKSWDQYADQARRRGREMMEALQAGFPGLTVFLTSGYSLPWAQSLEGRAPLAACTYGLLAPLLDGMVEAAHDGTRLVDGCELSYGYRTPARFDLAYQTMNLELLPMVADTEKYQAVTSLGFGIWMDYQWRHYGWDVEKVNRNYYTPDQFEASVHRALEVADEYVWVYAETPRWWSAEGQSVALPVAYQAALRRARLGVTANGCPDAPSSPVPR